MVTGTGTGTMLAYDFMDNALLAAGVVAVLAGVVGYFLVMRGQTFAGHALSHVGFAGATGAALIGASPLWGMIGLTIVAALGMGALGEKLSSRDVAIGMILSLSLGLGVLFLYFFTGYATQITALLFGNVLAVDRPTLWTLAILAAMCLIALAILARPLLFASLQPELAEAKGVPITLLSLVFLGIVAIAVAECVLIVGVLLVFTLMVGPAATASRLTVTFWRGLGLTVLLALAEAWLGIVLAYYTNWPTSFWITALSVGFYGLSMASLWRGSGTTGSAKA